ncbi:hypothetical protein [Rhodomicrobium sp.]|jgi:hypothetical protein|uniref:hypothetical protein n=1 Tax=Rhodomicrobium sp. TaxID=2720632 RepID=UPI0039E3D451
MRTLKDIERLKAAHAKVARLAAQNPALLPVFMAFERDMEKAKAWERAREVAQSAAAKIVSRKRSRLPPLP